jgi:hypothetical protein
VLVVATYLLVAEPLGRALGQPSFPGRAATSRFCTGNDRARLMSTELIY